jgi:parvulin-like peptidyl-prolyl isomerase
LESLIEKRLILQEYKKREFIPDYYFGREERRMIREQFDGDRQILLKTLEDQGITMAEWKKGIRENYIVQTMRGLNSKRFITVSPEKIESYYRENIRDFLQPDRVQIRMIFRSGAQPESRELVASALREFEGGADFAGLARKYDEYNPREGGYFRDQEVVRREAQEKNPSLTQEEVESRYPSTGWVSQGYFDKEGIWKGALNLELSKVAFALRPGQVSGVLEVPKDEFSSGGFFLLRAEAVNKGRVTPLSQARLGIENTLAAQENEKIQLEWVGYRPKRVKLSAMVVPHTIPGMSQVVQGIRSRLKKGEPFASVGFEMARLHGSDGFLFEEGDQFLEKGANQDKFPEAVYRKIFEAPEGEFLMVEAVENEAPQIWFLIVQKIENEIVGKLRREAYIQKFI